MNDPLMTVAVAWPWDEADRVRVRAMFGGALPVIVPGSIPLACSGCRLTLAVGPYTTAVLASDPTMDLLCLWCALRRSEGARLHTLSLGNPDSRPEDPS